ncbi:MAG: FmdB family transcriptional regulator [Verrucomicrobia bacterium]|nr:MAG: FmdB family transcriptional regulator [Verrucomicrobiota bacterium]
MPVYRYATVEPDGSDGEIFEVEQSAAAPALSRHPENGKPVRRIYEAANINSKYTPGREKSLSDISRIKKAGFQVLQKDRVSGKYFKK